MAIHYASNRAAAEETAARLPRGSAPRAEQQFVLVGGNVGSADGPPPHRARRRWPPSGRIDALVNNAGIAPRVRADILEATEESFDELIAVNLKGPYFLSQAVARHWLAAAAASRRLPGGYKLVFVSSISAYMRLDQPRRVLHLEGRAWPWPPSCGPARLAAEGVQVFEVRPGIMATDMTAGVKEKYDQLIAEGLVPQGRWGTARGRGPGGQPPCSKGSFPFSTGDVINVDGGIHLQRL